MILKDKIIEDIIMCIDPHQPLSYVKEKLKKIKGRDYQLEEKTALEKAREFKPFPFKEGITDNYFYYLQEDYDIKVNLYEDAIKEIQHKHKEDIKQLKIKAVEKSICMSSIRSIR